MQVTSLKESSCGAVLRRFLEHPIQRVLVVKGEWGAGKTFAVRTFMEAELSQYDFRAFSYVSLFGLSSLREIKDAVLANAAPTKAAGFKTLRREFALATPLLKSLPKLKEFGTVIDHLTEKIIKNFVVCFDDLERRSDRFSFADFFGLVSLLKEERRCKVVVVFNADAMSDLDKSVYDRYREKVIDFEFKYHPSVNGNLAIVFKDQQYPELVFDVFRELDVRNIRVMLQVAWSLERFLPFASNLVEFVRDRFLRRVAILTVFLYERRLNIDFTKLDGDALARKILEEHKGELGNSATFEIVTRIRFVPAEIDKFIIRFLQTGDFEEEPLKRELFQESENEIATNARAKLSEVWRVFNGNFVADETTVIKKFSDYLDIHAGDLSWQEVRDVCDFLKKFESNLPLTKWLDSSIGSRVDRMSIAEIKFYETEVKDMQLLERLHRKREELLRGFSLRSLVFRIGAKGGWNPDEDSDPLDSYSAEDWVQWLTEERDDNLLSTLKVFQRLFKSDSADPVCASIGQKLEAALTILAARSRINSMRLEPWLRSTSKSSLRSTGTKAEDPV